MLGGQRPAGEVNEAVGGELVRGLARQWRCAGRCSPPIEGHTFRCSPLTNAPAPEAACARVVTGIAA